MYLSHILNKDYTNSIFIFSKHINTLVMWYHSFPIPTPTAKERVLNIFEYKYMYLDFAFKRTHIYNPWYVAGYYGNLENVMALNHKWIFWYQLLSWEKMIIHFCKKGQLKKNVRLNAIMKRGIIQIFHFQLRNKTLVNSLFKYFKQVKFLPATQHLKCLAWLT